MSRTTNRLATALALAALLALSSLPAQAAGAATPEKKSDLVEQLWSWITGLWEVETLEHRCTVDPNGCPDLEQLELDHRCTVDPNGGGCAQ